jgi:hypothetical protein
MTTYREDTDLNFQSTLQVICSTLRRRYAMPICTRYAGYRFFIDAWNYMKSKNDNIATHV